MASFSQRTVNRLVIGAVLLAFAILLVLGVLGAWAMGQNLNFTNWVNHTYQVQQALSDYRILNERLETSRRGYLLSHEPTFLVVYRTTREQLPKALERVERLTADNPAQQENLRGLRQLVSDQIRGTDASVAIAQRSREEAIAAFGLDTGVASTRAIRVLTSRMDAIESQKLQERDSRRVSTIRTVEQLMAVAGLLLLLTAVGSLWAILAFTRDLTRSRDALEDLNEGLEAEVEARTADLQRANDEIQRFAYIVSHDLRSPLVNVMGFTSELEAALKPLSALVARAEAEAPQVVAPEARLAVAEDLPEAIHFIRGSTQKMDRLINAILQLSRQGRRVLAPEQVDMQALAEGVANSLKHRSDELGARIEVAPGLPSVFSDRLALEQIVSNLVENALKYLQPGRPGFITVRGERRPGDRLVYEVADNGRGIDPKDHERIFELFRRSGPQDQPGEGIGLAHVRAVAYRLGGAITVESALDRGSTFRVSLPAKLSLEGAKA